MADFDTIYEEDDEPDGFNDETLIISVPDPVVVRGAGNITVYVEILSYCVPGFSVSGFILWHWPGLAVAARAVVRLRAWRGQVSASPQLIYW